MPWPQTAANQYYAQLGLTDKGREIKGNSDCNSSVFMIPKIIVYRMVFNLN